MFAIERARDDSIDSQERSRSRCVVERDGNSGEVRTPAQTRDALTRVDALECDAHGS